MGHITPSALNTPTGCSALEHPPSRGFPPLYPVNVRQSEYLASSKRETITDLNILLGLFSFLREHEVARLLQSTGTRVRPFRVSRTVMLSRDRDHIPHQRLRALISPTDEHELHEPCKERERELDVPLGGEVA
jgi:hypothetical protein